MDEDKRLLKCRRALVNTRATENELAGPSLQGAKPEGSVLTFERSPLESDECDLPFSATPFLLFVRACRDSSRYENLFEALRRWPIDGGPAAPERAASGRAERGKAGLMFHNLQEGFSLAKNAAIHALALLTHCSSSTEQDGRKCLERDLAVAEYLTFGRHGERVLVERSF
ncbi:MAG: hypothetical protein WAK26_14240 [Terracidiphilus sp.]